MPANTPYLQQLKQWMLHSFAFAHGGTDVDPGAIPMHPALGAAPAGAPTAQKVQPTQPMGGLSTGVNQFGTYNQQMVRPDGSYALPIKDYIGGQSTGPGKGNIPGLGNIKIK
jgi:hypothetical protein